MSGYNAAFTHGFWYLFEFPEGVFMKRLAIFDLDNTLLGGDSDHAWGEFLIAAERVNEDEHRRQNNAFYQQYLDGNLDMTAYLEFAMRPVAGVPRAELDALHARFMTEFVEPMMLDKAAALLQEHRDKGDYLLIVTATNRFITEPIAQRLGVDDLIATDLEERDGVFTGKIAGIPCFQSGKIDKLKEWLERQPSDAGLSLANSVFYSDSFNDLPLMEAAAAAVAVDPDPNLREQAEQRGWPIISLRS